MSTIELKITASHSKWKPDSDGRYITDGVEKRVDAKTFDLSNQDQQEQLRGYLRIIDRDFNPGFGAWDRNLTYVIPNEGIFLKNEAASGPITREALDRMLGYKRNYPI